MPAKRKPAKKVKSVAEKAVEILGEPVAGPKPGLSGAYAELKAAYLKLEERVVFVEGLLKRHWPGAFR